MKQPSEGLDKVPLGAETLGSNYLKGGIRGYPLMMFKFRGREGVHEIRTLVLKAGLINKIRARVRGSKILNKIQTFMDSPLPSTPAPDMKQNP